MILWQATQPHSSTLRSAHPPAIAIALACTLAGIASARAVDEGTAGAADPPPVAHAHLTPHPSDPAAAFAKRLGLDRKQQAQVGRLLAIRQAEIRRVWNNPAIASSDRVGAVKAINEKTVAQIRALLTEEQKQMYIQPRPAASPASEPQPSVEDWLNAIRSRNPDTSAEH